MDYHLPTHGFWEPSDLSVSIGSGLGSSAFWAGLEAVSSAPWDWGSLPWDGAGDAGSGVAGFAGFGFGFVIIGRQTLWQDIGSCKKFRNKSTENLKILQFWANNASHSWQRNIQLRERQISRDIVQYRSRASAFFLISADRRTGFVCFGSESCCCFFSLNQASASTHSVKTW